MISHEHIRKRLPITFDLAVRFFFDVTKVRQEKSPSNDKFWHL
jgi:hypothetical protein